MTMNEPKYDEQRTVWYYDDVYSHQITERDAWYRNDRMWWIPSTGETVSEGYSVFFSRKEALKFAKLHLKHKIADLTRALAALETN